MIRSGDILGGHVSDFYLFPPQATAVQWWREREMSLLEAPIRGGILADEPGHGKTRVAAAVIESNVVPTTLYVCPVSTIHQVQEEFMEICKNVNVYTIEDARVHDENGVVEGMAEPFVLIVNKEKLTAKASSPIVNSVAYFRVILDEADVLRNGQTTEFYRALSSIPQPQIEHNGRMVDFGVRWAMSGRPIGNSKDDLVNVFQWINPLVLRDRANLLRDLRGLIRTSLFRRLDSNLTPSMKRLMDFPVFPPELISVPVKFKRTQLSSQVQGLQPTRLRELIETNPDFVERLSTDELAFTIAATLSTRDPIALRSVLSYPLNRTVYGVQYRGPTFTKIVEVMRIIRENPGSFVVFHEFEPIHDAIVLEARKLRDYTVLSINGTVLRDKRVRVLKTAEELIQNRQNVILLLSLKTSAVGLNCQLFSRMIVVDQHPNPQIESQAQRRIYRIGQTQKTTSWTMNLEPIENVFGPVSVDERVVEIKNEKEPILQLINEDNAAHRFRRYTYINSDNVRETGVLFSPEIENSREHDSIGPIEIN
jgi:SNF2 family DNA or RNA helicase